LVGLTLTPGGAPGRRLKVSVLKGRSGSATLFVKESVVSSLTASVYPSECVSSCHRNNLMGGSSLGEE
jgi:hypothetical protein